MSSYKVLPPYGDLGADYYSPLLMEPDVVYSASTDDFGQLGTFQNLQTLVEVSSLMSGQQDLAWETQDGVRSLQAALNSQPPVPMPLTSWDTNTNNIPKLEGLDTIDLSTAPLMRSSPPMARPTILPQRSLVVTHPYSTPMGEVHNPHNPPQYVNLDGELLSQGPHTGKRIRVKSREKSGETGEVRPCRVCGERAGKHSYYGGQVCPSCRAFFRRSVQSGYNATYFCVKDGNCEVTLKTRKNCQYCRYKLCEAAGMKTTWVLTDEERKQKFEGRGKRKSCSSESPVEEGRSGEEASTAGRKVILSEEELSTVEGYVRASDYWEQSKVNDMDTGLIRQIIRMVAFRANLDESGQNQLRFLISERTTRFASSLLEFQSLCAKDRDQILGQNMGVVMTLKTCSFFHPRLEWTSQLSPLLGVGEVDKLNVKLRSLNVSGLDRLKLSYKQFFPSPFLQTEQAEIQFTELLTTIGSWPQDEKEYVLVSLVLLFCPDMLDLVERRRVEDCQLKFATLLQKYLTNKHSADQEVARSRFTSGMQLVTKCKELHNIISSNRINLNVL